MNLAVQDTCRSIAVMADAFDTVLELSKIFTYSPKKKAILLKLKSELAPDTPGLKPLCPTRWTVRAESLRSVLLNYNVIQSVLEDIVEEYRGNSEATAGARGVLAVMERFSFLFGVTLAEKVLSLTDSLSRAIQAKHVFAFEAKKYVAVTEAGIKDFRSDSEFKDFWQQVNRKAAELNIDEPTLPRRIKAPKHFDQSNTTTHAYHTPEDFYRRQYLEVIDTLTGEIERIFGSESFALYTKMEKLLLSAAKGELTSSEDLQEVVSHFGDDLDKTDHSKELALLKNVMTGCEYTYETLRNKILEYRCVFPQVLKFLQLLFVILATSAKSERSFSALRNNLMIIHIQRGREINIKEAMSEFITRNNEHVKLFGSG